VIIRSGDLTEGLFGEALTWILELLPYIESSGLRPEWDIRNRNYGAPPTYNIFPSILHTTYVPDPDPSRIVSFETLKNEIGFEYRGDFSLASRYWHSYFRFADEVYERLDRFFEERVLCYPIVGVHYRGTDKNSDITQTNSMSRGRFLSALEDFLTNYSEAKTIFIASDDSNFIDDVHSFAGARWVVLHHPQLRSKDESPIFNRHGIDQNLEIAASAVLDCLTLSRCQSVLTTMSALSAFAKVLNPDVEVYRASCCKPDWFPVAYTKRYRGREKHIRAMLSKLQTGDCNATLAEKIVAFPPRLRRKLTRTFGI
jgi:hypothetical protein